MIGEDAITDSLFREKKEYDGERPVSPKRIGITGSAVLRDCSFDLFAASKYLGSKYPTTIGVTVPLEARDMLPVTEICQCKLKDLKLICNLTPTTNQVAVRIEC